MTGSYKTDLPTQVRWRIVGLLAITAVLCHFNRACMAIAGTEHIIGKRGVSETVMGTVYSAYLLVYTLLMMPGGWLIDRRGPRSALLWMGFGSAVFVALTGAVGALVRSSAVLVGGLLVVRGLLGSVSTPMHPGAARVVSLWTPPSERSLGNGVVTCASLIGYAVAPPVFGAVADRAGWPATFVLAGAVTALSAVLWTWYARNGPRDHPSTNQAERALIDRDRPPLPSIADRTPAGLSDLLLNRSLIFLTLSYASVGYFQYLFIYWIQYYFTNVLKLGRDQSRNYTTVAMLAMAIGIALGGWVIDRIEVRLGQRRGRVLVCMGSMTMSALFLGMGILRQGAAGIVAWFVLAMGVFGLCEAAFWTTATQVGASRGGVAAAIMNTGGNGGGLLAPVVTPLFAGHFGWKGGLGLACGFSLLGALCWLWIDPTEQAVPLERAGEKVS